MKLRLTLCFAFVVPYLALLGLFAADTYFSPQRHTLLVVVTSILGPMLTEHFGRQRLAEQDAAKAAAIRPQTVNHAVG